MDRSEQNSKRKDFRIRKPPPLNGKALSTELGKLSQTGKCDTNSADSMNLQANDYARYTRHRWLGQGGVANVNSGFDTNLDRQVAIKLLKPAFCNDEQMQMRFVREAKIMATLEHPSIVPVHEVGIRSNCLPYFTMKKVNGISLQQILTELVAGNVDFQEKYSQTILLRAFIQICQAMAYSHSQGILHRDLKPSNIQLGEYGEVYVMDWGLAKKIGISAGTEIRGEPQISVHDPFETEDGHISGTPLYMSPEQASGCNSLLDERSDIYSLGTVLYEMLTHTTAIPANEPDSVFRNVRKGRIIPPRKKSPEQDIPPELDAIVMNALMTDPNKRYHSVIHLLHDIEHYLDGRPISVYRASLPKRFWKFCKRNAILSSTIAASVTVALLLSFVFLFVGKVKKQVYLRAGEEQLVSVREKKDSWRAAVSRLEKMQKQDSNGLQDSAEVTNLQIELREQRNELLNNIDLGIHMLSHAGLPHIDDGKCRLDELNKLKAELLLSREKLAFPKEHDDIKK